MRTLACLLACAYSNDETVVFKALQQLEQLISAHAHLLQSKCINAVYFYLTGLILQVCICFTEKIYENLMNLLMLIHDHCWHALEPFEVSQFFSNALLVTNHSRNSLGHFIKLVICYIFLTKFFM